MTQRQSLAEYAQLSVDCSGRDPPGRDAGHCDCDERGGSDLSRWPNRLQVYVLITSPPSQP
jgi:hypothetical protein